MSFLPDGMIGKGAAECEIFWNVRENNGNAILDISSPDRLTCSLKQDRDGVWKGRWIHFEKMEIELSPQTRASASPIQRRQFSRK